MDDNDEPGVIAGGRMPKSMRINHTRGGKMNRLPTAADYRDLPRAQQLLIYMVGTAEQIEANDGPTVCRQRLNATARAMFLEMVRDQVDFTREELEEAAYAITLGPELN